MAADGRGGKRPGAGRPRKADKHAGAYVAAEEQIKASLPLIIDTLFELAKGIQITNPTTGKVYSQPPDRQALTYLADRVLGRPTERRETELKVSAIEDILEEMD